MFQRLHILVITEWKVRLEFGRLKGSKEVADFSLVLLEATRDTSIVII